MSTIPDQSQVIEALRTMNDPVASSTKHLPTCREDLMIATALHQAIKLSEAQVDNLRRRSDEHDMKSILTRLYPNYVQMFEAEEAFYTESGS